MSRDGGAPLVEPLSIYSRQYLKHAAFIPCQNTGRYLFYLPI